ncbi:MAG: glycosyltransferase [bacterium]|nr:glycosyltransferase [bacterium]
MNVLYLSYDGLTDPLGSSQVLPYVVGLSKLGHKMSIVSFEKAQVYNQGKATIVNKLEGTNIKWIPLKYTKKPPIISTIWDLWKLKKCVKKVIKDENTDIIHCRSYITSLIGQSIKKQFGIPFIFDMRGFYADERVDGGIWNLQNPIFNSVYNYFKRKEREFLENADHTISLTFKAKEIIHTWDFGKNPEITVIPTCVETNLFEPSIIEEVKLNDFKKRLEISSNDFILSYIGSLGTWYQVEEMMEFFKLLKSEISNAKFLIITKDSTDQIRSYASKLEVMEQDIITTSGTREEIPYLISLSSWSIFFIKPVFSKAASAPTKMGEIVNMRIPIVCNTGVGDLDNFTKRYNLGQTIISGDKESYNIAIEFIKSNQTMEINNDLVTELYSLEKGITKIDYLYNKLGS